MRLVQAILGWLRGKRNTNPSGNDQLVERIQRLRAENAQSALRDQIADLYLRSYSSAENQVRRIYFLGLVLQAMMAARFRPDEKAEDAIADSGLRGELFRYSRSIVLGNLGDSVRLQLNPLMISKIQGVEALPAFSIGTRLITILEDAVNSLFGGQVLSAFGQIHGADDTQALRRQFLRMVQVTTGFASAATVGMVTMARASLMCRRLPNRAKKEIPSEPHRICLWPVVVGHHQFSDLHHVCVQLFQTCNGP